jgi:hypothetical protein
MTDTVLAVSPNGQQYLPVRFNLTVKEIPHITIVEPSIIYQQDRSVKLNITGDNIDQDTILQILTPLGVVIYETLADSQVSIPPNTFQLDVNLIRLHVKGSTIFSNEK